MTTMRQNFPALTSLRFFAAMFVVVFHYNLTAPIFPAWAANFGYESVTFFFVLSGFILTYTHCAPAGLNMPARDFITARGARILPAYFAAMVLALPQFVRAGPALAAPFVVTMTQAWIPEFSMAWNGPAWSLSNEMFFYLCFPLMLWFASRVEISAFIALSVAAIGAASIARLNLGNASHDLRAYLPLLNLPQFMAGIALGLLYVRADLRPHRLLLPLGIAVLALVIALGVSNVAILVAVFSIIIFGACRPTAFLDSRLLVLLGEASYAIYILHVPLWVWWFRIEKHVPNQVLGFALYLSAVIIASIATLYLIEKPGRRIILRIFSREVNMNDTLWHRCDAPLWPVLRGADGRFFLVREGAIWRRRYEGKWQYRQHPETEDEFFERNVSGF